MIEPPSASMNYGLSLHESALVLAVADAFCLSQSLHKYALGLLVSTRLSKGTIETLASSSFTLLHESPRSFLRLLLSQATGHIHVYYAQQLHVEASYLFTLRAIINSWTCRPLCEFDQTLVFPRVWRARLHNT